MNSINDLVKKMLRDGGAIVSSDSCSAMEIACASQSGNMFVDENGLGYILRSKKWLDRVHERDGYMQPPATT